MTSEGKDLQEWAERVMLESRASDPEPEVKVRLTTEEKASVAKWANEYESRFSPLTKAESISETSRRHLRWSNKWTDDGLLVTHAWDVRDEVDTTDMHLGDYDYLLEMSPVVPPGCVIERQHVSVGDYADWFDTRCASEVWHKRRLWHEGNEIHWTEEIAGDPSADPKDRSECIDLMLGRKREST